MPTDRAIKQAYFLLFAPLALQAAYVSLYLERRGLSHGEIGLTTAVSALAGVIATLVVGHLADRAERKRHLTVVLAVASAVAFGALWFGRGLLGLLVIWLVFGFCRAPMIPLSDAHCLDVLASGGDRAAERYGRLRMWGSIGFIVASFAAPVLVAGGDKGVGNLAPVFGAYVALGLLHAARLWRLADPPLERPAQQPRKRDLGRVVLLPGVPGLLFTMFLSTVANSGYYLYLSLYLEDIGVPDRWVGAYWGLAVVAEVMLLGAATRLLQLHGPRRLMLWGYAARGLRLLAYSAPLHPLLVLAIQPLHALAFGACHAGSIAYLARCVPQRWRATGQAALAGLSAGLGGLFGNWLAGWLSDAATAGRLAMVTGRTGLYAAFWLLGWLQVAALLASFVVLREPPAEAPEPHDG